MTKEEWIARVGSIPANLAAIDRDMDFGGLRVAIVEFWRILDSAPTSILHLYKQVKEQQVLEGASATNVQGDEPDFNLSPPTPDLPLLKIVAGLAVCLRALETEFRDGFLDGVKPDDPNSQWRVAHPEGDVLLVPIPRVEWKPPNLPADDDRPFKQRGLRHIRIIPAAIDGEPVRIVYPDLPVAAETKDRFGAVLFRDAVFKDDGDDPLAEPDTFLITGVSGTDMPGVTLDGLRRSHYERCLTVVFPELTVDDELLATVSDALATKPWMADGHIYADTAPAFVVAGSWHRQTPAGFENVGVILDGYGVELLRFAKRYAASEDGKTERISSGNSLQLLVTDKAIFAFGICLDFCQGHFESHYVALDADFVLVPSCGNDPTMAGHLATAVKLHQTRHTRAFVVQQYHEGLKPAPKMADSSPSLGYILQPDGKPSKHTIEALRSSQEWTSFKAEMS